MKRLAILGGLIGAFLLLVPSGVWAQDLYSIATHPFGANRFTENLFGRNPDTDTSEESIWNGNNLGGPARCFAATGTTATALYLFSDDENDAAKVVRVEALDSNWDPVTIDVTVGADSGSGGTDAAQVGTTTLLRVNRAYATTTALVGNVYINADNVDAGADGVPDNVGTKLVAGIAIGQNQTVQSCYTVPNDFNGFLTRYCTTNVDSAADATMEFRLRSATNGGASIEWDYYVAAESASDCSSDKSPPIMFPEKTDVDLTGDASAVNASSAGSMDMVFIKNSLSGL